MLANLHIKQILMYEQSHLQEICNDYQTCGSYFLFKFGVHFFSCNTTISVTLLMKSQQLTEMRPEHAHVVNL